MVVVVVVHWAGLPHGEFANVPNRGAVHGVVGGVTHWHPDVQLLGPCTDHWLSYELQSQEQLP